MNAYHLHSALIQAELLSRATHLLLRIFREKFDCDSQDKRQSNPPGLFIDRFHHSGEGVWPDVLPTYETAR